MYRRARIAGYLGFLAFAVSAVGLSAQQDSADRVKQIVEQLDRLQVHQQELRDADFVLDSILEARELASRKTEVDTATVGPFLVVAIPDQLDDAVAVFTRAWSQLEGPLGGWVPPQGSNQTFVYHKTGGDYLPMSREGVQVGPWHPRTWAEARALAALEKRIFNTSVPRAARAWASKMGLKDRQALTYAYRNLVVTAAESARDCFEGESDRCWDALGLRNAESAESRWTSWYDAAERSQWEAREERVGGRIADLEAFCQSNNVNCARLLLDQAGNVPIPAEPLTRASFLGHVLRVGGEGALTRLREGEEDTPLADQLVHASGVSPDALMTSWREEVLAAAPPAPTGLSLKLLSGALLWSLVFSGFAMRSTRWRA